MPVRILARNCSATREASAPSRMICGRIRMISSVRYVRLARRAERAADQRQLVEAGHAGTRYCVCVSLTRPASSTIWPLLTEIWLLTLRSEIVGVRLVLFSRHAADLLLDVELDAVVGADARLNVQNDAGVLVVDGVDDGVVGAQHSRAAGRDRHLIADLQRRVLVVDHHQRRVRRIFTSVSECSALMMACGVALLPTKMLKPAGASAPVSG